MSNRKNKAIILLALVMCIIICILVKESKDLKLVVEEEIEEKHEIQKVLTQTQEELNEKKEDNKQVKEELGKTKKELKKAKKRAEQKAKTSQATRGGSSTKGGHQDFQATFYCACTKCCGKNAKGITATGTKVTEGRTIAVDPNVIPLGSKVEIEGFGSNYIAEDTGSAVKGNIVDIYVSSHSEAMRLGRQNVKVRVLK